MQTFRAYFGIHVTFDLKIESCDKVIPLQTNDEIGKDNTKYVIHASCIRWLRIVVRRNMGFREVRGIKWDTIRKS